MKPMRLTSTFILALSVFSILFIPFQSVFAARSGIELIASAATIPAVPITYSPSVDTITDRPAYIWSQISGATGYYLVVKDTATGKIVTSISVSSTHCSTATRLCSYTPAVSLTFNQSYKWAVKARNGTGYSAYSPYRSFYTRTGFTSSFNNSHSGWVTDPGGTWTDSATYYFTTGIQNHWSSTSYYKTISSFSFEVRLKNTSTANLPYGLIFRGTPTFRSNNGWMDGYYFLLNIDKFNKEVFSIWRVTGGLEHPLHNWEVSSTIHRNDWNNLKVVADGKYFQFFINGTLVWSGSDSTFSSGKVGMLMFRWSDAATFTADWAKMGKATIYTTPARLPKLNTASHPVTGSILTDH